MRFIQIHLNTFLIGHYIKYIMRNIVSVYVADIILISKPLTLTNKQYINVLYISVLQKQ